jgi:chemotaxis protein MotB
MRKYILLSLLTLASCVPAQKFKEVNEKSSILDNERNQLMAENERLTVENTEMKSNRDLLNQEKERFVKDSLARYQEMEGLRRQISQLNKKQEELQANNDALLQRSAGETRRLLNQLQSNQDDLQSKEARLRELEQTINAERIKINRMSAELDARNVKLAELEQILNRQDSVVNALRDAVSKAMFGFEGQGLSVNLKNGKVYVSLEEQLLFKSGSIEVDARGVEALKRLARVLDQNPDINVMIEGHTDDVPIRRGGTIKDNWDLSVMRATSIIRILLDGSKIDPTRLTASGRSEYLPVDPAKTTEARRKNRRTEIILTPKLDELLKILQ